ncbi:MAG TPA: hypothetical protein VE262_08145 [Blastocatellia bacterium]|nr:hypothetical protein [Blastocatellia bacterium]
MTDFLTRLAERTLMASDVARPVTAPMFAPARGRSSGEASEGRGEEEADSMSGLLETREASARDLPGAVRPREIYAAEKGANTREAERGGAREKATSAPIIKVSIGRIEVRALGRQTTPAPRARPGQQGPALTLDQYLKQRDEGKR